MIIVVGNIEFDGRIDGWWIIPVNCWVVNVVVSLVKVARKKKKMRERVEHSTGKLLCCCVSMEELVRTVVIVWDEFETKKRDFHR